MKNWFRAAAFSLVAFLTTLSLEAAKKPAPTEWMLDADMDSNPSVLLKLGETKQQVVAELGKPKRIKKSKKVPDNETLYYRRSVLGPLKQSTVRGSPGMIIRNRIIYVDEVEVVLEKDIVTAVDVTRRLTEVSP